jgi:hypothetical protein
MQLPPKKVTQAAIGAGMARVEKTQAVKMITPGSRVISIMGFHITNFDSCSRPWISLMLQSEEATHLAESVFRPIDWLHRTSFVHTRYDQEPLKGDPRSFLLLTPKRGARTHST